MSYVPIIILAFAAFLIAIFVLKLERRVWTLFGAVLVFGLAGYATQGAPHRPGSPKAAAETSARESGEAMVAARQGLFEQGLDNGNLPPAYLVTSDGFARQGKFAEAAAFLRKGLADNPGHAEGWLALANALVEHAQGQLTPASLYAFRKADAASPDHPGIAYYLGIALLRSGRPEEARGIWSEMLAKAPKDASWRAEMEIRLEQLDKILSQSASSGVRQQNAGPPQNAPSQPAE